jgi:hypothetical protein
MGGVGLGSYRQKQLTDIHLIELEVKERKEDIRKEAGIFT